MFSFAQKKKVWVLNTGVVDPYSPAFKELVDFIKALPGFFAAHPHDSGMLWLFDSKELAMEAKAKLTDFGAKPSPNICRGTCQGKSLAIEAVDN